MTHLTATVGPGRIEVHRDGEVFSGFTTGIPTNSFTIRKLAGRARRAGWVVADGRVREWKPLGLVEHEGLMYVYGPHFPGVFLQEVIGDPSRDKLADLVAVADALAALKQAEVPIVQVHTQCMLLSDSTGVLVLPPDVVQAIREHQDINEQLQAVELFTHPDKRPEENVGFFLAALAYRALTGRFPFEAESSEELHSRIRDARPVDPRLYRHELDPGIARELTQTLGGAAYELEPAVWRERFLQWKREGTEVELSTEEREALARSAREQIRKLERAFKRKESVRKHWRTALIVAAIAVVAGMVPGTIIRNALKPRATAGMSPSEVVVAFYTSINALDHMTMEDAVVDGAGRPLIREVTNLYVIDRQRMSVEFRSGFVDAAAWSEAGKPSLEQGVVPYGVTDLGLTPMPAEEGTVAFRVDYERWLPNFPEEGQTSVERPYVAYEVTDEVRLRQDREDWVIYELTTVDREPVDLE